MSSRYRRSERLHSRALKTIPLGSQTFSKSMVQYPYGVSPYFITRARGSKAWDADGNQYIDFINSLAAVTLGYNDRDVNAAVRSQMKEGIIFSLPHPIEMEVAERITTMVPCAEMVRFGKNGSDATAGAVRLARAYTGRDHVAVCGYHGWQDWYIGSTARNLGVPKATSRLTHTFRYNDLRSLDRIFRQHAGRIAAVIMEPMNTTEPLNGFLEEVQAMTRKDGAILIFDETITGFRYANGGAQEYFGVVPDLATFGKGLANGYPVSAVAGRAKIMHLMEQVFFSFTFGGEALSLAAARATLDKLTHEPVVKTLAIRGHMVVDGLRRIIEQSDTGHFLSVGGHPSWTFLMIRDSGGYSQLEIKTLFLQEMFSRGILTLGTHNMSYAHSVRDVRRLLAAYNEVVPLLKDAVDGKRMKKHLRCRPLEPLFKVR